jgi:hypothetical protein
VSRQDPKHGRWILPLVIAGLVGFTYIFVNALPPTEPTDATGDTTVSSAAPGDGTDNGTGDGTDDGTGAASSSTVAQDVAVFLLATDDYSIRTAALAAEAQRINDDWDARTADFADTRDALTEVQTQTAELATEISDQEVPEGATEAWNVVITSAQTMTTAAADMLDGLVNSSTADKRLGALATYVTTAADLESGLDLSRSAVGG